MDINPWKCPWLANPPPPCTSPQMARFLLTSLLPVILLDYWSEARLGGFCKMALTPRILPSPPWCHPRTPLAEPSVKTILRPWDWDYNSSNFHNVASMREA